MNSYFLIMFGVSILFKRKSNEIRDIIISNENSV